MNLYATYNKFCKLEPNENFDQKFPIPESNLMTHIYVTVDPDIDVRSIQ